MRFGELRKYIPRTERVSICMYETQEYQNYQFISQVPESCDDKYLYGIGRVRSLFPLSQAPDVAEMMRFERKSLWIDEIVYAECIEIMLSETPRNLDAPETEIKLVVPE